MESESIFEDDVPNLENTNLLQWQYNRETETYEIIRIDTNKVVIANLNFSQIENLLDRYDDIQRREWYSPPSCAQNSYRYNLESMHPRPQEVKTMRNALNSEQRTEITKNLNQVYDVVEGIANQIKRTLPPWKNDGTGEWEKPEVDQCATDLLDAVRKLQVVIGEDSHDDDSDEGIPF